MSIGNALCGTATEEGRVGQSNYGDRKVPRIDITMETHVHFFDSVHLPGSVGEPGVQPDRRRHLQPELLRQWRSNPGAPVDPQLLKV